MVFKMPSQPCLQSHCGESIVSMKVFRESLVLVFGVIALDSQHIKPGFICQFTRPFLEPSSGYSCFWPILSLEGFWKSVKVYFSPIIFPLPYGVKAFYNTRYILLPHPKQSCKNPRAVAVIPTFVVEDTNVRWFYPLAEEINIRECAGIQGTLISTIFVVSLPKMSTTFTSTLYTPGCS